MKNSVFACTTVLMLSFLMYSPAAFAEKTKTGKAQPVSKEVINVCREVQKKLMKEYPGGHISTNDNFRIDDLLPDFHGEKGCMVHIDTSKFSKANKVDLLSESEGWRFDPNWTTDNELNSSQTIGQRKGTILCLREDKYLGTDESHDSYLTIGCIEKP